MSDHDWKKAKALGPMEMVIYALTIAMWEAEQRGDLTPEQTGLISARGDELIHALVKGKAIVKDKTSGVYEIIDAPKGAADMATKANRVISPVEREVLVIKPKGETQ